MFKSPGLRQALEKSNDLLFLKELTEACNLKPFIERHYRLNRLLSSYIVKSGSKF